MANLENLHFPSFQPEIPVSDPRNRIDRTFSRTLSQDRTSSQPYFVTKSYFIPESYFIPHSYFITQLYIIEEECLSQKSFGGVPFGKIRKYDGYKVCGNKQFGARNVKHSWKHDPTLSIILYWFSIWSSSDLNVGKWDKAGCCDKVCCWDWMVHMACRLLRKSYFRIPRNFSLSHIRTFSHNHTLSQNRTLSQNCTWSQNGTFFQNGSECYEFRILYNQIMNHLVLYVGWHHSQVVVGFHECLMWDKPTPCGSSTVRSLEMFGEKSVSLQPGLVWSIPSIYSNYCVSLTWKNIK